APAKAQKVKLVRAEADVAQAGFPVAHAIDSDVKTGWAIESEGNWHIDHAATFTLEKPLGFVEGTRWTITLDQSHGTQHTIGRFRLKLGQRRQDDRPLEVRRKENLDRQFDAWAERESAHAVGWQVLRPVQAKANLPLLTVLEDGSVLASGDQSK